MEDKADKIIVEGPQAEVDKVMLALESTVKDLLERLTFAEIVIDPKYHKHIIGNFSHIRIVFNIINDVTIFYYTSPVD